MARMTTARAIVRSLVANGVDTVFALPGVQLDALFNALHDERNRIRVVHPRHEQAAAYMALGYAQASGKIGAYVVVPGPGILNTTAALATAYGACAPVLAITGQLPARAIGQGYGLLHEIPDQLAILRGLTKWAERIDHPTQAPGLMNAAFHELRSGVPRPVGIESPMDVLGLDADIEGIETVPGAAPPAPDAGAIADAAKLMASAEHPVIVVGGGALHARDALREVAETLQAPVVSHRMGRGILDDRHPLSVTQPAGAMVWKHADAVLAVGTRFGHYRTAWGAAGLATVRIDVDPAQMHRLGRPTVPILADARPALETLAGVLGRLVGNRSARADEIAAVKAAAHEKMWKAAGAQIEFLDALRAALPEDGIFVDEMTQVGYVAQSAFPVHAPRTYISSGYQGTLGAGFPTALGAQVACPDRAVLSINGDGGFMFNAQELSTAVQQGLGVVAVVFEDGAYGNVKRMQEDLYGGRVIASELRNPDFVKFAESFGATAVRVDSPDALRDAVATAWGRRVPTIVSVSVGRFPSPFDVVLPTRALRAR